MPAGLGIGWVGIVLAKQDPAVFGVADELEH